MSNYEKCLIDIGPRLKKRGFEDHQQMSQNICQMRFADDDDTPRQFSQYTEEDVRRSFALDFELDDITNTFPENFDDTKKSLEKGEIVANKTIDTICDGLRAQIGTITFPIIQEHVDGIITVSESEIIDAMKMVWERMKIIAEPSSVITLGALLSHKELFQNKKVGMLLSGGNVDLNQLPW